MKEIRLSVDGREGCWFDNGADRLLVIPCDNEMAESLSGRIGKVDILAVTTSWNRDLSPWSAPDVFRGQEPFAGGANAFLQSLENKWLPKAESMHGTVYCNVMIAGYSLAGLFALYASTKTDRFCAVGSVSGSLWYERFDSYIEKNHCYAKYVDLSLGDRESISRSPYFQRNQDTTLHIRDILCADGVEARFTQTQGNHFNDPVGRTESCIRRMLATIH